MFLDESAFDLDDNDKGFSRRTNATESRFSSTGPGMNVHDMENINDDDDNDGGRMPSFGSAGGIGTPSSSRARMLAQQRDIQLKKRQTAIQSGGMIRSSIDNPASSASSTESGSPAKPAGESQFTPAVRHFSAPKAFRDETANDQGSEFRLPVARKPVMQVPQTAHNYQSQTSSNRKSSRFSDDEEEEEEEMSRNSKNAPQKGTSSSTLNNSTGSRRPPPDNDDSRSRLMNNSRNNEYEEDDDDEYDYRKSRSYSSNRNQRPPRGRNNNDDEDEDTYNEGKGKQNRGASNNGRSSSHNRDDEYEEDRRDPRGHGGKWEVANGSGTKANDRERDRDRDRGMEQNSRRDPHASEIARQGSQATARAPLNLSNMKQFLTSPLPRNAGVVQCYIRRNKSGTNKLFPVYSLYLKDGDSFLMASKKRPNNKTSNYLISMAEGDLSRDGANYLGKLRSNFVGTEFQIFDNGSNPKESEADEPLSTYGGNVRKDLGAVMYAANVLGSRGPRKMQVAIPSVDEFSGGTSKSSSGDDILTRMRDRSLRDLAYLINKPPRWNEQVGAYVLNFNGRVTMASVKNFQLVDPEEQNSVVLQFGRVAKDEFTMDMQWPITPFQAFAVTLSSFDSKIACD